MCIYMLVKILNKNGKFNFMYPQALIFIIAKLGKYCLVLSSVRASLTASSLMSLEWRLIMMCMWFLL